ncbi:hypothetical protein QMK34_42660 [Amycolatopsis sp. H20-H5]|nr:hypothetical protein [Amycolatopsis sp. H20-H5]
MTVEFSTCWYMLLPAPYSLSPISRAGSAACRLSSQGPGPGADRSYQPKYLL